ncbi:hypothetical protein BRAS3843_2790034 [Bradyrhizobium sp. STM 3843]|uniref:hypothetical protein n=1 Tax=Bradyrhizobium sp. STM 3843 TaxID=551947 RepID=UPI0002404C88|nr:hypothetical protein [Bradyrhizobium sp. STM 3843]CCE08681.1 hypothetical protein BRAS3843_2790034 [Bradyrhizobium sp. STM 3843]
MSATELKDFLAAMDVARQANMAALEAVDGRLEGDFDEDVGSALSCRSVTIH